jgi:hypothetical protein
VAAGAGGPIGPQGVAGAGGPKGDTGAPGAQGPVGPSQTFLRTRTTAQETLGDGVQVQLSQGGLEPGAYLVQSKAAMSQSGAGAAGDAVCETLVSEGGVGVDSIDRTEVTVPQTGSVAVPTLGAVTLTAGQSVFMFCSTNTAGGQYTIKNLRLVLTRVGALTTAAG